MPSRARPLSPLQRGRPIKARFVLSRQPPHSLALDSSEIRGLAEEFRGLQQSLAAAALATVRRMGEILVEGRRLLRPDLYDPWLPTLCVSHPTVKNYTRVYRLAKDDPETYARCEDLAVDKVYRLATVPRDARARVLDATHEGICAADLSVKDFRALVRRILDRPLPVQTDAAFAAKLPARLASALGLLETALTKRPRIYAPHRREILVLLRRICPLSMRLSRSLARPQPSPTPPSSSPTLPPPAPQPKPPKPRPTLAAPRRTRKAP
jgi:hypothetical protein